MMTSFGVLALILGLSFTTEMWEEIIQMVPNYESIYPGFSASSVKELFLISGVFILMEGMLALMTYYLMKKRTNHKLAVIICAITSLLSVGAFGFPVGIFSLAIGLYVTYQIYKNKAIFTS